MLEVRVLFVAPRYTTYMFMGTLHTSFAGAQVVCETNRQPFRRPRVHALQGCWHGIPGFGFGLSWTFATFLQVFGCVSLLGSLLFTFCAIC